LFAPKGLGGGLFVPSERADPFAGCRRPPLKMTRLMAVPPCRPAHEKSFVIKALAMVVKTTPRASARAGRLGNVKIIFQIFFS
jgi:hypothetical protein